MVRIAAVLALFGAIAAAVVGEMTVAIWGGFLALVLVVRSAGEYVGREPSSSAYRRRLRLEVIAIALAGVGAFTYGILLLTDTLNAKMGSDVVLGLVLLAAGPLAFLVLRIGLKAARVGSDEPG